MARTLEVLQRIRDLARKTAEGELRRAEAERDRQQERVDLIAGALATARASCGDQDVLSLDAYHTFRLQGEMASRREDLRLHHRTREVEARSQRHISTVRDQLAVETLIERRAEDQRREGNRREAALLDEVGARMRSQS